MLRAGTSAVGLHALARLSSLPAAEAAKPWGRPRPVPSSSPHELPDDTFHTRLSQFDEAVGRRPSRVLGHRDTTAPKSPLNRRGFPRRIKRNADRLGKGSRRIWLITKARLVSLMLGQASAGTGVQKMENKQLRRQVSIYSYTLVSSLLSSCWPARLAHPAPSRRRCSSLGTLTKKWAPAPPTPSDPRSARPCPAASSTCR